MEDLVKEEEEEEAENEKQKLKESTGIEKEEEAEEIKKEVPEIADPFKLDQIMDEDLQNSQQQEEEDPYANRIHYKLLNQPYP